MKKIEGRIVMRNEEVTIIKAKNNLFEIGLRELFRYKDLIILFVKRNFATRYKQTILGSAWLVISPMCVVVMNTLIFGYMAGLSTEGVPKTLFYLSGNIMWTFFAGCLNNSANVFVNNAGLFGKIYFPRLVTPISSAITEVIDFFIKFVLMLLLMIIYSFFEFDMSFRWEMFLLPIVLLQVALLGMGLGIIISSLTTKYRDLQVLVGFGMSIWMYLSPVVYSIYEFSDKVQFLYLFNPVAPALLIFKYAFLGSGYIPWFHWGISWGFTIVVTVLGILIFNRVEKTFMDTV